MSLMWWMRRGITSAVAATMPSIVTGTGRALRRMARVACLGVAAGSSVLAQQSALPADRLAWDQVAGSLSEANSYRYQAYLDGSTQGVTLAVTCAGDASPYVCAAALPPLMVGDHSLTLTAASVLPDGRVAESAPSAPLTFRLYISPTAPTNLRITAGVPN